MNPVLWIPIGLGVALLAGIVFAMVRGTAPYDKGFMTTAKGLPIQWNAKGRRLMVYVSPSLKPEYRIHLVNAMDAIEAVVKRKLFLGPDECMPALEDKLQNEDERKFMQDLIYVCDDEGTEPEHGRTELSWDERTGYIRCAYVRLPEAHSEKYGAGIVLHEMCHALGLAHDQLPESIMWPTMQERPGTITARDAGVLSVYAA